MTFQASEQFCSKQITTTKSTVQRSARDQSTQYKRSLHLRKEWGVAPKYEKWKYHVESFLSWSCRMSSEKSWRVEFVDLSTKRNPNCFTVQSMIRKFQISWCSNVLGGPELLLAFSAGTPPWPTRSVFHNRSAEKSCLLAQGSRCNDRGTSCCRLNQGWALLGVLLLLRYCVLSHSGGSKNQRKTKDKIIPPYC